MPRTPLIAAALLGFGAPGAAAAQVRGSVEQIGTPQTVGMQQVTQRPATVRPVPQISRVGERAAPAQLTIERGSGKAGEQVTRVARSAQSSQPLSQPRDGRSTAVERLAGDDRCDPGTGRALPARCARAIETRAAEFARDKIAEPSPEQRIIAEQKARERSGNFGSAARRLAASGNDAGSLEAQGVASIALTAPPEDKRPDTAAPGAMPSEAVLSIINAIVNAPPPR